MSQDATSAPALDHGEDGYLTIHGLRHHYIRWGAREKDPVVLLHGLMNNARYWEHIASRFADRHAVYAPDLRGHGESEHAPGGYLVWAFAMDLRGFVEEMDFESFDLVAHSIGSRVAMSYARDHSHRLNHLVLADMGPEMAGSSDRAARTVVESPRAAGFATEAEAIAYYATLYPAQTKEFLQRQVAASLVLDDSTGNLVFRFDPSIHQATGRAAIAEIPYLWESLEHIKCPTLVIRAENSKVLNEEIARQMVERLPDGRYLEIAGSGHQVPLQQPDAFSAAIADFLDR